MSIEKVVLAYSGGLDTSVILQWLKDTYDCEVVTFTADLGQPEEVEPAREKALVMGVPESDIYVDDLREEFVADFVYPMFRANTIYEGEYLLGTSIARPLIAKRLVEIAAATGADAISHGATGKGNDQVRFELGAYALAPDIRVIAPWREWDLLSREKLMAYAADRNIPIEMARGQQVAVFDGRQPVAHLLRGGTARESLDRATGRDVAVVGEPGAGPHRADLPRARVPKRRHRGHRRRDDDTGRGADGAQRGRRGQRRWSTRHRREPLRGDEDPRSLREPREGRSCCGPIERSSR